MPLLSIETNQTVHQDKINNLVAEASRTTASLLGKPESYVMVRVTHNPDMMFAGTQEPLAYLELKSLGLPEDRTTELSRGLCDLMSDGLDIPAERIYIEFTNGTRHLWGWNGGTF
jgi:phenylpyruvate tautomerase PptA (4-oxalocrotonate tautomerase family)